MSAALGLPDQIRGCLFDLDGVLTKTAKVHDAAWQEMFDGYLRERSARSGEPFVPFDPARDYDEYVDGKPRADGTRSFLESRGITLPEGEPGDAPDTETVAGLSNRKNKILLRRIREDGVEAYPGSVRYVQAARDAGLRRAVVSSSANCRDVLVAAGIEDLFEARVDGLTAGGAPARQAGAGHVPGRGPGASGCRPPSARCSRTRWPGWRPAGRASSAAWSGSTGSGRRTRCARTARRGRDRSRRAAADAMIKQATFPVEPWTRPGDHAGPGPAGADRVGVRAVQRAPGLAGQPGRGRAARPAGHLPERGATRSGRCPTPRPATASRSPGRRSST